MWKNIAVRRYRTKEELLRTVIRSDDRVLDIGFWGQAHTKESAVWPHRIIQSITPNVWGVDLTYDASVLANSERYQKVGADAFEFNETFSVIVALDLIEHLPNPGLFLDRVKKHLAPGGRLIITTPNTFNLFAIAGKISRPEPATNSDHTMYLNRPTIHTLLKKCGWSIKEFGVLYTLGDLHVQSLKKKVLNLLYRMLSKITDKFYETLVVTAVPGP